MARNDYTRMITELLLGGALRSRPADPIRPARGEAS